MPGSEDSESLPIPPVALVDGNIAMEGAMVLCAAPNVVPLHGEEVDIIDPPIDALELNEEPLDIPANEAIINEFVERYTASMAAYPHLQLGEVNVRERIGQLIDALGEEGIQDYRLEDFSAALFEFGEMPILLNALNQATGALVDADAQARVGQMVRDLVLFSSLVPTRDYKRKVVGNFSELSRYTLQVLTPKQVIATLTSMSMQLVAHPVDHIHDTPAFEHLHLDNGDNIRQRMVKLALMSTPAGARAAVYNDALFGALLNSPDIAKMLFASTGADEQYFLNTCPMSARNTDMAARTSNLITMVHAGENLIRALRQEVANGAPEAIGHHLTVFQTAGGLVEKRCHDAERVFASIRAEIDHMLQPPGHFNYRRVKRLRKKWSRTMQKLGGVVNWTEADEVPHLSKKYIKDHYYASGVVAILGGLSINLFMPNTRTFKRPIGPDEAQYIGLTRSTVEAHSGGNSQAMSGVAHGLDGLWKQLYKVGGSPFSANSAAGTHALYIKAIVHDGQPKFAINDPMQRSFAYMDMAQMQAYVNGRHAPRIPNAVMNA